MYIIILRHIHIKILLTLYYLRMSYICNGLQMDFLTTQQAILCLVYFIIVYIRKVIKLCGIIKKCKLIH